MSLSTCEHSHIYPVYVFRYVNICQHIPGSIYLSIYLSIKSLQSGKNESHINFQKLSLMLIAREKFELL